MPLIQYCPNCWAENPMDATVCERCTTSFSETAALFYDQKLLTVGLSTMCERNRPEGWPGTTGVRADVKYSHSSFRY